MHSFIHARTRSLSLSPSRASNPSRVRVRARPESPFFKHTQNPLETPDRVVLVAMVNAFDALAAGAKREATPAANSVPWLEKYRPKTLDDLVGNEDAVERMRAMVSSGFIPNLIFSGPPGCGKTSAISVLARELLGDKRKEAVLEMNASDERGIDVVRNKIKMFAQKKVTLPPGRTKIVILDEADSMTTAAQQAMRRTMEIYSATTRFALACNTSEKVIEPIQSRCAIVRFQKLSDEQVLKRLMHVVEAEKVPYVPKGLEAIVFTADGDMRQALNNLQSTFMGFDMVNEENVFKVCDQPHPNIVRDAFAFVLQGNIDDAHARIKSLHSQGYSVFDIIGTMYRVCKNYDDNAMPEYIKLELIRIIGFTHLRLSEGCATMLQLDGCLAKMCELVVDAKKAGGYSSELGIDAM